MNDHTTNVTALDQNTLQALSQQPNTRVFRHEHVAERDPYPVSQIREAVGTAHGALLRYFRATPDASEADDQVATANVMAKLPVDIQKICRAHPSITLQLMRRRTATDVDTIANVHFVIGLWELVEKGAATEEQAQQMFVEHMLAVTRAKNAGA